MKMNKNRWKSLLLCTLLVSGCSAAPKNEAEQQPVTKACTAQVMGMDAEVTMTAPQEDADIDKMTLKFKMPASYFGLENLDSVTEEMQSVLIDQLAQQLDLNKEDITTSIQDDVLNIEILIAENDIREVFELEETDSLKLNDLVSELESAGGAVCS